MDDHAFLHAFETDHLSSFRHRDHVRLAWMLLREFGWDAGSARLRSGLRHLALAHGAPDKYHETLTLFWAGVVNHAIARSPECADFEAFIAAYPMLLDAQLPSRHYSDGRLWSDQARADWVEPDLIPLPAGHAA